MPGTASIPGNRPGGIPEAAPAPVTPGRIIVLNANGPILPDQLVFVTEAGVTATPPSPPPSPAPITIVNTSDGAIAIGASVRTASGTANPTSLAVGTFMTIEWGDGSWFASATGGGSGGSTPSLPVPSSLAVPTITGSAIVGQTLQASPGTWNGGPTSFAYQWYRGATAIAGATGTTYVVQTADIGSALSVFVTANNAAGTASAQSVATANVVAASVTVPQSIVRPLINGQPAVGQVLTCGTGTWSNTPSSYTYQWYDQTLSGATPISGATSSTYIPQTSDVGDQLYCQVTASNLSGSGQVNSGLVGPVPAPAAAPSTPSVRAKAAADALGTSVSPAWNEATEAGSTLLAVVTTFNAGAITPPAGGWFQLGTQILNDGYYWTIYAIDSAASQSGAREWQFAESGSVSVIMLELLDLPSTTLIDVYALAGVEPTSGTTYELPACGPTSVPDVALAFLQPSGFTAAATNVTATGWTFEISSGAAGAALVACLFQAGIAAGATLPAEPATITATYTTPGFCDILVLCINDSQSVTPPTPTGTNPSGTAMPVGNLPGWDQIFADDFATPLAYGAWPQNSGTGNGKDQWTNWNAPYDGAADTSGQGIRSVSTFCVGPNKSGDGSSVPASVLDTWQHLGLPSEPYPGQYVSGVCLPSVSGYGYNGGREYQRITFAARAAKTPGFKWVPLLWNDSETGNEEIDCPEGDFSENITQISVHFPNGNQQVFYLNSEGGYSYANPSDDGFAGFANFDPTVWHVYDQLWTPGSYQLYIDGVLYLATVNGETFDQFGENNIVVTISAVSMHWVLQTETSTFGYSPTAASSGHVQFDWVTIYEMAS